MTPSAFEAGPQRLQSAFIQRSYHQHIKGGTEQDDAQTKAEGAQTKPSASQANRWITKIRCPKIKETACHSTPPLSIYHSDLNYKVYCPRLDGITLTVHGNSTYNDIYLAYIVREIGVGSFNFAAAATPAADGDGGNDGNDSDSDSSSSSGSSVGDEDGSDGDDALEPEEETETETETETDDDGDDPDWSAEEDDGGSGSSSSEEGDGGDGAAAAAGSDGPGDGDGDGGAAGSSSSEGEEGDSAGQASSLKPKPSRCPQCNETTRCVTQTPGSIVIDAALFFCDEHCANEWAGILCDFDDV